MDRMDSIISIIDNLYDEIEEVKTNVNIAIGRRDEISSNINREEQMCDQINQDRDLFHKTIMFLNKVVEHTQTRMEEVFANIGTSALKTIFEKNWFLSVKFQSTKSETRVVIQISQPIGDDDEFLTTDLEEGEGGAVVDVISFTLRVAMLELYHPIQHGPLLLDETFKFIADDEKLQRAGQFLKKISNETNRQILLITHQKSLLQYADKYYEFESANNKEVKITEYNN